MSTSDTPDIDEKKETTTTVSNNFNVSGFIKDVIKKTIYMLIYIFLSGLVLYGTKIYGPKMPEASSNLWSRLQAFVSKGGKPKTKSETMFEHSKITFIQPVRQTSTKGMAFMKKQMMDTYNYTFEAFIFFFNFLYNFQSDAFVAVVGPLLFGILMLGLTIFGFICFIYYYISNLFYNFSLDTNPFISCILVMFCIVLLFMLFSIVPFIQIIVSFYCLINIMGYESTTTTPSGVEKTNFYGFLSTFMIFFYNYIMIFFGIILVTSAMNYLGQEYGIICAVLILLDYYKVFDFGIFKEKKK